MIWFGEKFSIFHLSNFKTYVRVNSSVLSYKHIDLHFTIHWYRLRFVFIFICGKVRQMKSQKMNKIFEFSFSFSLTVRNGLIYPMVSVGIPTGTQSMGPNGIYVVRRCAASETLSLCHTRGARLNSVGHERAQSSIELTYGYYNCIYPVPIMCIRRQTSQIRHLLRTGSVQTRRTYRQ